jgi:hypothetical protein
MSTPADETLFGPRAVELGLELSSANDLDIQLVAVTPDVLLEGIDERAQPFALAALTDARGLESDR